MFLLLKCRVVGVDGFVFISGEFGNSKFFFDIINRKIRYFDGYVRDGIYI